METETKGFLYLSCAYLYGSDLTTYLEMATQETYAVHVGGAGLGDGFCGKNWQGSFHWSLGNPSLSIPAGICRTKLAHWDDIQNRRILSHIYFHVFSRTRTPDICCLMEYFEFCRQTGRWDDLRDNNSRCTNFAMHEASYVDMKKISNRYSMMIRGHMMF